MKDMLPRDYLWCALNLLLDEEEKLEALCPACRAAAEQALCPICGADPALSQVGVNAQFDMRRFQDMKEAQEI